MTDEHEPAGSPEPDASLERARVEPSPSRRGWDLLPGLYLLGFLVLVGTLIFLWQNPPRARLAPQDAGRVDTLQSQLNSLRGQVAQLKEQPTPAAPAAAAPDLAPLQTSLQTLQSEVAALRDRPAATPDALAQLSQQVQGLANRPGPDLSPLQSRLDALEARPKLDPAALDRRFSELSQQLQSVGTQVKELAAGLGQTNTKLQDTDSKLAALSPRLDALETQAKQTKAAVDAIAQKAALATRLQAAAGALAAGQKLGDIPGAPPALARFANEAPPTEASLKESFDHYAAAATHASQPAITDNQDFGSRMWTRAQQALTIRQGDRVLVGDPVAGVLTHAREQLDAGDLAGTVAALKGLAGPAAQAMQPWIDRAQSLLDARAAIASMAAG